MHACIQSHGVSVWFFIIKKDGEKEEKKMESYSGERMVRSLLGVPGEG
jgi:hypothetical protein